VLSAFLNNVTTILLVVPVTLLVRGQLKVPVYPFLFAEVFASNLAAPPR
jgi:Na+/H+ antiporter NhaD/arsenite permease-like protein